GDRTRRRRRTGAPHRRLLPRRIAGLALRHDGVGRLRHLHRIAGRAVSVDQRVAAGAGGSAASVGATIVVLATKRWPMLSTITPNPSMVRTPSRLASRGSANTTSSFVS